jgi:hypothetical protein
MVEAPHAEKKADDGRTRVFITDSQSWEMRGRAFDAGSGSAAWNPSGGSARSSFNSGEYFSGGARPQTMEVVSAAAPLVQLAAKFTFQDGSRNRSTDAQRAWARKAANPAARRRRVPRSRKFICEVTISSLELPIAAPGRFLVKSEILIGLAHYQSGTANNNVFSADDISSRNTENGKSA